MSQTLPDPEPELIDRLTYYLRVFMHAHRNGQSVPPIQCEEAGIVLAAAEVRAKTRRTK